MGSVHYSDNESKLFGWLALTEEQFADKVERGVEDLKQRPRIYFFKLFGLSALGFSFIIALFVLSAGFIWWLVDFAYSRHIYGPALALLAFPPAVAIYLITMSLWPKPRKVEGIKIRRRDAPALFELIDDYSKRLRTRVQDVYVTENFNAQVLQAPFLDIPFLYRNHLALGIPLLASLTPDQFKSVLAHELGHLSGNHGRYSAEIYSMRYRWHDIVVRTREDSRVVFVFFYPFYLWLFSRFDAYSMALRREQERGADKTAIDLTSERIFASAMTSIEIKGSYWTTGVWPELFRAACTQPEAPKNIYGLALEAMRFLDLEPDQCQSLVEAAFRLETSCFDTHPSLGERVAQAGTSVSIEDLVKDIQSPIEVSGSAAEVFLADTYLSIKDKMSTQWLIRNAEAWASRHDYLVTCRNRLSELEESRLSGAKLERNEWGELIDCTFELEGAEACRRLWTELIEQFPEDPVANQQFGILLIDQDDETGIAYLEKAMNLHLPLTGTCLEAIGSFLRERGRLSEMSRYDEIDSAYQQEQALARAEREGASGNDQLLEHDFDEEFMGYLRKEMQKFDCTQDAYIAYKNVKHMPESPYLVLGLSPHQGTDMSIMHQVGSLLLHGLEMPCGFCVVVFDSTNQRLKEKFLAIPNSHFYRN